MKYPLFLNDLVCAIPVMFMSAQIVTASQSRHFHNLQAEAGKDVLDLFAIHLKIVLCTLPALLMISYCYSLD